MNKSIFNGASSKISDGARIGLIASVVVIMAIAIGIVIASFLLRRKYMNQMLTPEEKVQLEKLKIENPNYGIVLSGIQDLYKHQVIADYLMTYIINTIYLNKYQNIMVIDNDDYAAISIASLSYRNVYALEADDYEKHYDKITQDNPTLDLSKLQYINNFSQDIKFDLMLWINHQIDVKSYLSLYLDKLNDNGMIILEYTNKKELELYKPIFASYNLRYEPSHFKHKNVVFLAKNTKNNNEATE
ncbi:BC85_0335 family putative methyltransferase [Metamycoplasma neophronis]|uniref:Class I SAM-dependent methyltransferase n=1 Tax=Metamycoplasma neophronis TaxID=872983 RepID=A0ABY2Z0F4_9BACT|nr:hypothetical protein [Metamycoplasma neophronis]TPR54368.1 hypothetical protein FJR74_01165 [Metamycoplasma neophronis]